MPISDLPTGDGPEGLSLLVLLHMIAELRIARGLDTDGTTTLGRAKYLAHEYVRRWRLRRAGRGDPPPGTVAAARRMLKALKAAEPDLKSTAKPDRF